MRAPEALPLGTHEAISIMRRNARLVLLTSLIASCTSVSQGAGNSPCVAAGRVNVSRWDVVDAGPFSLRLPRGFSGGARQGIDSALWEWRTSSGWTVRADLGAYTGPFTLGRTYGMLEPVVVCSDGSGGKPQLVIFRTIDGYGAGLHMASPQANAPQRDPRFVPTPRTLWMRADGARPEDRAALLAILLSVQFNQ